jgi:hypothetical protein
MRPIIPFSTGARSKCTSLALALALALASTLLLSNVAFGTNKCGPLDRLITALRLTRTLYPEFNAGDLSFSFSSGLGAPPGAPTTAANLGILVDRTDRNHAIAANAPQPKVTPQPMGTRNNDIEFPTYLDFSFIEYPSVGRDPVCRPVTFINNTETTQMKEARTLINAHPEWADEKEAHAATDLGMRFGAQNKAALLKLVPLKELSTIYGLLRVKHVEFETHGNGDKCVGCSFADLHWYIEVGGEYRAGAAHGC